MKLHHPVGYAIADHAAKIFKTDEFKRAAKEVGLRSEEFQNYVVAELKRIVAAQRAEELRRVRAGARIASCGGRGREAEGRTGRVIHAATIMAVARLFLSANGQKFVCCQP